MVYVHQEIVDNNEQLRNWTCFVCLRSASPLRRWVTNRCQRRMFCRQYRSLRERGETLNCLLLSKGRQTSRIIRFLWVERLDTTIRVSNIYWLRTVFDRYLRDRFQAVDSDVCGQYCIYYIEQRELGRSMMDLCRDFRIHRHRENDEFVNFCNVIEQSELLRKVQSTLHRSLKVVDSFVYMYL